MVRKELKALFIERMREEDIPEILLIAGVSFTAPWSETSFFNQIRNPRSVSKVARTGGSIAGYIFADLIVDEGHILDLAVHPDFRKTGIGGILVKHVIDDLTEKECRIVFLEVRASNEEAIGLYEGAGFKAFAIRKNYYAAPVEDAVIMQLLLV